MYFAKEVTYKRPGARECSGIGQAPTETLGGIHPLRNQPASLAINQSINQPKIKIKKSLTG
jgi:hypothetical protein